MKKLKTVLATLAIGSLVIFGCDKNEITQDVVTKKDEQAVKKSENVKEIEILKNYLSEITGIKVTDISYDEVTIQFKAFGVNQISKDQLTKLYIRNN